MGGGDGWLTWVVETGGGDGSETVSVMLEGEWKINRGPVSMPASSWTSEKKQ